MDTALIGRPARLLRRICPEADTPAHAAAGDDRVAGDADLLTWMERILGASPPRFAEAVLWDERADRWRPTAILGALPDTLAQTSRVTVLVDGFPGGVRSVPSWLVRGREANAAVCSLLTVSHSFVANVLRAASLDDDFLLWYEPLRELADEVVDASERFRAVHGAGLPGRAPAPPEATPVHAG